MSSNSLLILTSLILSILCICRGFINQKLCRKEHQEANKTQNSKVFLKPLLFSRPFLPSSKHWKGGMKLMLKGQKDETLNFSGWIYTPWNSLCFYNFEIHHNHGEISHTKCHFSHCGSCSSIPYLLWEDSIILEQIA